MSQRIAPHEYSWYVNCSINKLYIISTWFEWISLKFSASTLLRAISDVVNTKSFESSEIIIVFKQRPHAAWSTGDVGTFFYRLPMLYDVMSSEPDDKQEIDGFKVSYH